MLTLGALIYSDCSLHNIMVCTDRDSTIDGDVNVSGVTPVLWSRSRLDRTSQPAISPAKFYFVGFGGAKLCKSDDWSGARVQSARDREPPEFHNPLTRYYNPLLLDIFLIGNMLRRMFLDVSAAFHSILTSLTIVLLSEVFQRRIFGASRRAHGTIRA